MHPDVSHSSPFDTTESAFFAIRSAEKLLAEARFYLGLDPALAQKLLLEARAALQQVLGYARTRQQDTARIERVMLEIEHLHGKRPALV